MNKILIIEDSDLYFKRLSLSFKKALDIECVHAKSLKDTAKMILEHRGKFALAIVDLMLPDSQNGEAIDLVTKFSIPAIALTGHADLFPEGLIRKKRIIDFIVKNEEGYIDYMVWLSARIIKNCHSKILIVDDSRVVLEMIEDLISRYSLQCLKAHDGIEAMRIVAEHPDIKLVFTDYHMPNMDGLELTKELRKTYAKDTMGIIVVTSDDSKKVLAHFLRAGANDYISKHFTEEEFYARLNSNLEILELFTENKMRIYTDFLTGVYNRRYLFEGGEKIFSIKDSAREIGVAILDIDYFKNINDTHGHDVGDIALKECTRIITETIDSDCFVARLGGEEFCIVIRNKSDVEIQDMLENIRKNIETNIVSFGDSEKLNYTISIGGYLSSTKNDTFVSAMGEADLLLYEAKSKGRNQVVFSCEN